MTSAHRHPPPQLPPGSLIGIGIALGVVGIFSGVRYFLDQQKYESAMQAYEIADCGTAIEEFEQVINAFRLIDAGDHVSRAEQKKAECEFFQEAVTAQKAGELEAAFLNYSKVAVYEDSPLLEPTREQLQELFQKADISLATPQTCNRLGTLATVNLLPGSETNVPLIYAECGKVYQEENKYESAIATYQEFLEQYPDHPLVGEVEQSLAQATVAEIKKGKNVREAESPRRTGSTVDGSTVVEIQNTSPSQMRITFSGPTPKFEQIETCEDCVMYDDPPESCPGKGPIGRYTLEPGQYDIGVEFKADSGGRVNPWVGTWSLEPGGEYKNCFFIVTNPLEELEDEEEDSF